MLNCLRVKQQVNIKEKIINRSIRVIFLSSLFLFVACGGGGFQSFDRDMNEEVSIFWEVADCFSGSGYEEFLDFDYFVPDVGIKNRPCGEGVSVGGGQVFARTCNSERIEVRPNFYYEGETINKTLFVHEYKHAILWQAGLDVSHDTLWFSDKSPCPDDFLSSSNEELKNK